MATVLALGLEYLDVDPAYAGTNSLADVTFEPGDNTDPFDVEDAKEHIQNAFVTIESIATRLDSLRSQNQSVVQPNRLARVVIQATLADMGANVNDMAPGLSSPDFSVSMESMTPTFQKLYQGYRRLENVSLEGVGEKVRAAVKIIWEAIKSFIRKAKEWLFGFRRKVEATKAEAETLEVSVPKSAANEIPNKIEKRFSGVKFFRIVLPMAMFAEYSDDKPRLALPKFEDCSTDDFREWLKKGDMECRIWVEEVSQNMRDLFAAMHRDLVPLVKKAESPMELDPQFHNFRKHNVPNFVKDTGPHVAERSARWTASMSWGPWIEGLRHSQSLFYRESESYCHLEKTVTIHVESFSSFCKHDCKKYLEWILDAETHLTALLDEIGKLTAVLEQIANSRVNEYGDNYNPWAHMNGRVANFVKFCKEPLDEIRKVLRNYHGAIKAVFEVADE